MSARSCVTVAGPVAPRSTSSRRSARVQAPRAPPVLLDLQPAALGPWPLVQADSVAPPLLTSVAPLLHLPGQHQHARRHQDVQQQQHRQVQGQPCSIQPSLAAEARGVRVNLPPPRPPPQQDEPEPEERDKDFFANVGDAIRTLREDYPLLFVKDLNYSIYRDDLVLKDPNLTFRGLKNYRIIFWSLRFHGRLFLRAAHVQVLRIWQPEDTVIKLRWQVNATPRIGQPGTFDGISIYRLDRQGRVFQHEVTDVQMRDPPITNPLLYGLNFILSPRPQMQQIPCPGSWFVEGKDDVVPDMLAAAPMVLPTSSQD